MSSGGEPGGETTLAHLVVSFPSGDNNGGASSRAGGGSSPRAAEESTAVGSPRVLDAGHHLERRAHEAEELFEAAFEQAPIGMAIVGIDGERPGRFLRVNRSLCEITGLSESDLVGTNFQAIVDPDDA